MSDAANYVRELIDSARTPEELQHAEQMLLQLEQSEYAGGRWRCDSLQQVAEFFSVSLSTVKQWRQESPPMPGDETGYDLREVVAWRIAKQAASPLREEKQRQELEIGELRKQQQQIELDKLRGALVALSDVEEWAAHAIVQFREAVMQIPQAVAQFAPVKHRKAIEQNADEYCRAALSILRQKMEERVSVTPESDPKPQRSGKKATKKPAPVRGKRNRSA